MKNSTRFFALLDIISIALLAKQFWQILTHLNEIPDQVLSQAKVILLLPLFVSLFISAIGLILFKKSALSPIISSFLFVWWYGYFL